MAESILSQANESRNMVNDEIGTSIENVLRGSHKTYKYVLVTAL